MLLPQTLIFVFQTLQDNCVRHRWQGHDVPVFHGKYILAVTDRAPEGRHSSKVTHPLSPQGPGTHVFQQQ